MDPGQPYVTFTCARVRSAPSAAAISKQFEIERQLISIHVAARRARLRWVENYADVSTTAGTRFLARPIFRSAVERARSEGAILMIEDIGAIARHLDPDGASEAIAAIRDLDIEVYEASTFTRLSDTDPILLLCRTVAAQTSRQLRAKRIKAGVKSVSASSPPMTATRKASVQRRKQAALNAARLTPLVQEIESALPTGQRLNANALATELNRRQIKSPRGGEWSYGSTSELLKRVRQRERTKADGNYAS